MALESLKNSTSIFMFSVLYLIFFSVFMFIVRGSTLVFSTKTIYDLILGAVGALIITAGAAVVASVLGSGGDWVWKGGLLLTGVGIFYFFMDLIIVMLPTDMPIAISMILIVPPFAGLGWVLIDKILLKGD